MRLTDSQRTIIRDTLVKHFGADTRIRLFGSRVDDQARGGDIDLFVEPEIQDPDALVDAKIQALVDLHRALGDQRIDMVISRKQGPALPIHRIARQTGLPL